MPEEIRIRAGRILCALSGAVIATGMLLATIAGLGL